jgi:hypothetical protein
MYVWIRLKVEVIGWSLHKFNSLQYHGNMISKRHKADFFQQLNRYLFRPSGHILDFKICWLWCRAQIELLICYGLSVFSCQKLVNMYANIFGTFSITFFQNSLKMVPFNVMCCNVTMKCWITFRYILWLCDLGSYTQSTLYIVNKGLYIWAM